MYKLTDNQDLVVRVNQDGSSTTIPKGHRFWDEYQAWVDANNTPEPADGPTPASPLEQIRAIESTPEVADAMQRGSRLVALAYALDDLIRIAASKGQTVTRQQAHDWAMVNDNNYKTLYDAEQAIKPLRALV